jgi:hypothetical protein
VLGFFYINLSCMDYCCSERYSDKWHKY